ncbi:MAG: AbrB/MazE/SpoVT family DNA-binding domain-containing protein [Nitrososphaeria archaeon]
MVKDDEVMKEIELKKVDTVRVTERGGSLQITIPKPITTAFGIKKGDRITFYIHPEDRTYIFLMKEREVRGVLPPLPGLDKTVAVFTSPLTAEEIRELIKKIREKRLNHSKV